jgi:uncharacterized protein (DUF58 family)
VNLKTSLTKAWEKADRPGVRAFLLAMTALSVAFVLALYSGAAARLGNLALASATALAALVVAGWVAVTLVPVLAKRTPLRWIGYRMEYRITRQGWIYIAGIVLVALAAINTGNNLLFLILACLIASILMSGVLSSVTLAGVEMRLDLPEHIFAGQTVRSMVEVKNHKLTLPSFSLRVEGARKSKKDAAPVMLATPVYFPYLPKQETVRQSVPLTFPRRGLYRQEAFRIVTRFPFGFLQKARRLDLGSEALVYPSVDATAEFLDVIPGIQGALESLVKGRGQDLYALRDYQPTDSARHVHWKASARSGSLMVREFAREDDCRVVLVFDPHSEAAQGKATAKDKDRFEQAVRLCAAIAWDFYERRTLLQFQSGSVEVPQAPAEQNIFAVLQHLALAEPLVPEALPELRVMQVADPGSFQIVVTSRARGTIPAEVWNSSYVVFAGEAAGA